MKKSMLAILLLAPGCGFMVQQFIGRPKTQLTAANPLRGTGVLEAHALSTDAMTRTYAQEETCDHWPVGDSYRVEISGDQVCVALARDGGSNQPSTVKVPVSAGGKTVAIALDSTGDETQIAHCQSGEQPLDVFEHTYRGCATNDGLISDATTEVTIDKDVSWQLHD